MCRFVWRIIRLLVVFFVFLSVLGFTPYIFTNDHSMWGIGKVNFSEKSSDSCCAAHESQYARIEWPFLHLTFYKLPLWFYK